MIKRGSGTAPQPRSVPAGEQEPQGAAGKIKRALKLLFGAADVSVYEVAGEQWVSPHELSGKAEEELRRAVKGKAKVGEPAPVPTVLSCDSAWSFEQQQQQQQHPPMWKGQGMDERLRQAAATVLGAGCPSMAQTIDEVYSGPAVGDGSSGAPSPRSQAPPDCEQGVELAAVVTHDGSGSSSSWDPSLGLSSSGAWGYAPGLSHGAAAVASVGPSGSSAGCSGGSGTW